jgi:preprotein translocase subunit SecD
VSLRWRVIGVLVLVLPLAWAGLASLAPEETRKAAWWLPDQGLRLGLDLRGGVHLVISPDFEVALAQELESVRDAIESQATRDGAGVKRIAVVEDRIEIEPSSPEALPKLREVLEPYDNLRIEEKEGLFALALTEDWKREVRERAMDQTLEVMRRRVTDPGTGIQESVVTRQGSDRILIQFPGLSRAPDIFRRTGFLEFKIVQDHRSTENGESLLRAAHPDGLPAETEILFERERDTHRVLGAYLVPASPDITGDLLADARVQFDSRRSEWQVQFTWNAEGAQRFGDLTGANVGKPLAIVLDDLVYSAPVVRDRISRVGVITGNFSSDEASDLAVILRSGALPIPVKLEEERTIGPALGADSIRQGLNASLVASILTVAFVVFYYRLSGLYASLALLLNLIMLIGLLALTGATLTMPGIAGLALTIGMAVDANVIVFERIRDELRAGKTVRASVVAGFDKAFWAIIDSNVTNLITALVLYEYGTGPIKGFAVTLAVGIVTSVFAALVITRLFFYIYPGNRPVEQLSI